ncbi:hypothetical protein PS273GM_00650 [Stutzerimonas stutzeri]|uniref:Uncharacterized protein n=1 Tax=Stutzerimonas stutzeri TaxID=316 RepID=A0A172WKD8_STUST|nr:hypothetical protein PS273GM_00650 [Stutzerimonas stutzeri]
MRRPSTRAMRRFEVLSRIGVKLLKATLTAESESVSFILLLVLAVLLDLHSADWVPDHFGVVSAGRLMCIVIGGHRKLLLR